jgi:hypothetical protein
MAGVRTEQLDTVKASILGNLELLTDFTAASSLYKAFIDSNNATRARDRDITIAGVGTKGGDDDSTSSGDGGRGGADHWKNVKPDMSVEERFYNRAEYRKLTNAQKAGLIAKRAARDGGKPLPKKAKGPSKRGKREKQGRKEMELSNRTIAKLVTAMRGSTLGPDSEDDFMSVSSESSKDEETIPMKGPARKQKIISNRENPALQRTKK